MPRHGDVTGVGGVGDVGAKIEWPFRNCTDSPKRAARIRSRTRPIAATRMRPSPAARMRPKERRMGDNLHGCACKVIHTCAARLARIRPHGHTHSSTGASAFAHSASGFVRRGKRICQHRPADSSAGHAIRPQGEKGAFKNYSAQCISNAKR